MCDNNIINIKNFYFTETGQNSEQYKSNTHDDFDSDFVIYEEKPNIIHSTKSVQTECNIMTSTEIQTELTGEDINKIKSELNRVKAENARLLCDIKEICMLVGIAKITGDNDIDMDKIKRHLTLIVNREIRQHTPMPFINVDSLSKKSSTSKNDKIFIL